MQSVSCNLVYMVLTVNRFNRNALFTRPDGTRRPYNNLMKNFTVFFTVALGRSYFSGFSDVRSVVKLPDWWISSFKSSDFSLCPNEWSYLWMKPRLVPVHQSDSKLYQSLATWGRGLGLSDQSPVAKPRVFLLDFAVVFHSQKGRRKWREGKKTHS